MAGISDWQNPWLPADVDADGSVTPLDAILVLNGTQDLLTEYAGGGAGGALSSFAVVLPPDLAPQPDGTPLYLDVDGDGMGSLSDYAAVVDALAGIIASQVVTDSVTPDDTGLTTWAPPSDDDLWELWEWLGDEPLDGVGMTTGMEGDGDGDEDATPVPDPLPPIDGQLADVIPRPETTCGVLPATAGPATFSKYQDATGRWIVGTPAFTPLDDAQNEGLLVGQERNNLSLLVNGRPFDESNDVMAPVHADNWFLDDTYYAWLEVVAVRTYTRYDLIAGATLSNATTEPLSQTLTLSQTKTSGWTVGAGLTSTTAHEVVGNTGAISAKASNALQKQINVATSVQTSQSVTKATSITAPPCSVVSLYQMYDVVEVQIDYVQWVDSALGWAGGFTPVRGTFLATSLVDLGHHTEQAGPQSGIAPAPMPAPIPGPTPLPAPSPTPTP